MVPPPPSLCTPHPSQLLPRAPRSPPPPAHKQLKVSDAETRELRRPPTLDRQPGDDPLLVARRGHQAGDDQLPHPQAGAGRALLREDLRAHQGLGVSLRQVQALPVQGHHLRQVRRRGDPEQGPPGADGAHQAGLAGVPRLVLQGHPLADGPAPRHEPAQPREGPLLRQLHRHLGGREGAPGPPRQARPGHRRARHRPPGAAARRGRRIGAGRADRGPGGRDGGEGPPDRGGAGGAAGRPRPIGRRPR